MYVVKIWVGILAMATAAHADEFFEKKIRPVLVERCYGCHSEKLREPKAGLRLDSREGVRRGGDSGPAIVTGKPEESRLIKAISYTDFNLRMPPTGKLSDETIADFAEWVRRGAEDPRETGFVAPARLAVGADIERGRKYWAFQPLSGGAGGTRIDELIEAKLAAKGLKPAPAAPRTVWLRRVTFDLTGLPPTTEEVDAFLKDRSSKAFETVVDRLLASPHYGERYGRHWLDLVRYAETNGHEYDNNKLDAWRYRDYVVRAFNEDLPYGDFVREQIAGDLLPNQRVSKDGSVREAPLGTGMYWFGEILNSPTDSEKSMADQVDNQIDVLSKTFLGLTVACARCHDHKFDPIPTKDYYGLAGILHSTMRREAVIDSPARAEAIRAAHAKIDGVVRDIGKRTIKLRDGDQLFDSWDQWTATGEAFSMVKAGGVADSAGRGAESLVGSLTSKKFRLPKRYVHVRLRGTKGNQYLAENEPLRVTLVANDYRSEYFVANGKAGFDWVSLRMVLPYQRMSYFEIVDRSRTGHIAVDAIVLSDHKEPPEVAVEESAPWGAPRAATEIQESAFAMVADDDAPHDVRLHIRGSHQNLGEPVPRHVLSVLSKAGASAGDAQRSGRLELAEWLSSRDNALAARVIVNRIWKHHFGQGLARTTDNFGLTGERPEQRELLEHLAAEFVADGGSIKRLNRRIVLSAAYRRASVIDPESAKADPRNELLQHFPVQRLEAEALRDAMLAVSGGLNPALGGPSVTPYISKYQDGRGKPKSGPLDGEGRRSIYTQVRRNFLPPMFLAFDYPLPISTIGSRSV